MDAGGPPVPPQTPGTTDQPAWSAPGSQPGGGSSNSPSGLWWGGAAVVAIALAVGGYFLGSNHESDNYQPGASGYQAIYTAGAQAGTAAGAAAGTVAGKKAGARYGKAVGYKTGNAAGIKEGQAQGTAAGAKAALGGFSWTNGTHYIVSTIDPTLSGVPTAINTQAAMVPNTDYALCQANPAQICSKPETVK
ncbi:MAG: hypothetical protein WCK97_04750 [Actinomycetes bacterium]